MRGGQFQIATPFTGWVKRLVIANVTIWLVAVVILQNWFLDQGQVFNWFGMVPLRVITEFCFWQPFTYMFLHSANLFHVLFNMLILWMFGTELEQRWGSKFFMIYYMVCGVGAAAIYLLGLVIYYLLAQDIGPMLVPVVGASGAVFGIMLAYGMIFGERQIYFMMLFPMKAKHFVMILGGIEVVSLLNAGPSNSVANLAHIGGLISGFIFLYFYTRWKGGRVRKATSRKGRKLHLVVDNEREGFDKSKPPRYWN